MMTVRGLAHEHNNTANGVESWQNVLPTALHEKKLGLLGLGNLGKLTAKVEFHFVSNSHDNFIP